MNKNGIRLVVIPTYKNLKTDNYYIFNDKYQDNSVLDTILLDQIIKRLKNDFEILQIEIYCECTNCVSDFYFTILYYLLKSYSNKVILTTNLYNSNKDVLNRCDIINVNFNFLGFNNEKIEVFNIIKSLNSKKVLNIKTLDICCGDIEQIIKQLNNLNIKSWEIVPYHAYVNSKIVFKSYDYFESVVKKALFHTKDMKFAFQNKLQLDEILKIDNYNIKTIYITPHNTYGLIDFTKNNEFQMLEYEKIEDLYDKLDKMEKIRDNFCYNCNSKIRCLANRFINTNYTGKSCSGFKNLIDFYDK